MKILATGCMHSDSRLANELAIRAKQENVDMVLVCGDLTMSNTSTEGLMGPFKKLGLNVAIIPGNHEPVAVADFLAETYGVKNLHGDSLIKNNIGFFGCGAANIGIHRLEDQDAYYLFYKGFKNLREVHKKIMVSHVPPSGTLMEKLVPGSGSDAVRKAVESFKPDFLFCSHLHEAEGIEEMIGTTKVINVGRKGTILDI
ncbi:MAG: metallophosphoesterase [Candidatus Nanoarchaeia archaeon]|nr:metallophosphoesterase [Candidatus Nanoarchaeia archaeon]